MIASAFCISGVEPAPATAWDSPWIIVFKLAVVLLLVLLNGFFVASEFAIVKVRGSQLQALADQGERRAELARHVTGHLDAYLSATQLGITLASLGLGWLGEEYLARSAKHRKLGRPYFIDKMPNNFAHVGLIHLILPNAKIIDARRHPLACGWSCFRQHFARGQNFTYDLTDIGRYYRDYVELMKHFDSVLPGRVHRVVYEGMVADTEREVRALLDYCGLPFEEGVLRFFENERPVRTASSEQVRQPIYKAGVDHWQHFEPWLDPLKEALGSSLGEFV